MTVHAYCPFKTGRANDDTCYEECQLWDDEKGCCVFVVMAMELERIRRGMKK